MKYNIFVLCGGKSVEHEISLKSAAAIINSIDKSKFTVYPVYIDYSGVWHLGDISSDLIKEPKDLILKSQANTVYQSLNNFMNKLDSLENTIVFPALHGQNGEDGKIQGFLEILDVPYVGCGVLSSAIAMDKSVSRDLMAQHKIPQTKYLSFENFQWLLDREKIIKDIEDKIGYPIYVKPSNSGSSVGISRVESRDNIVDSIDEALKYDNKVLIEKEVLAREMQVSVVGNHNPMASLPGEFIMERAFFDYDAKYVDNSIKPVVPANLNPETTEKVMQLALDTYRVLNCRGLSRIDIFVDDNNNIFVNEANTMPGFTPVSMTPVLWKATDGTSYTQLVEKLIDLARENFKEKQKIVIKR